MYEAMVVAHEISGFLGLLGSIVAILTRFIKTPHSWHIYSGRIFTLGMVGVGLTGLIIAWVQASIFFLSLAFFVLYLAVVGWRYAVNRGGMANSLDRVLAIGAMLAFIAMTAIGGYLLAQGNGSGLLMAVFGTIGLLHSIIDVRGAFGDPVKGKSRIAAHLSRMLGGTIAALTAFLLIQFESSSPLLWFAPAMALMPVIGLWKRLVKRDKGLHENALPAKSTA